METQQGRVGGRTGQAQHHGEPSLDRAGASPCADTGVESQEVASMNLSELRSEATRLGISYTMKDTKALLTLRIRDTTCPDKTLMTLVRFQGIMYKDIPKGYADWTVREMEANRDNIHPDLLRFALWHQDRMKAEAQGYSYQGKRLDQCEAEATIPPPPVSETGTSASWTVTHGEDLHQQVPRKTPGTTRRRSELTSIATSSTEKDRISKDEDDDPTRPIPPKTHGSTRRRAETTTPATTRMDQDVPEVVKREIQDLETRLALLRDDDEFYDAEDGDDTAPTVLGDQKPQDLLSHVIPEYDEANTQDFNGDQTELYPQVNLHNAGQEYDKANLQDFKGDQTELYPQANPDSANHHHGNGHFEEQLRQDSSSHDMHYEHHVSESLRTMNPFAEESPDDHLNAENHVNPFLSNNEVKNSTFPLPLPEAFIMAKAGQLLEEPEPDDGELVAKRHLLANRLQVDDLERVLQAQRLPPARGTRN
ncbi:GIP, partial [Symbiodinium pilosum]